MKRDPGLWAQFRVARELSMTVEALQSMSLDEFTHWVAFLSDDANR